MEQKIYSHKWNKKYIIRHQRKQDPNFKHPMTETDKLALTPYAILQQICK